METDNVPGPQPGQTVAPPAGSVPVPPEPPVTPSDDKPAPPEPTESAGPSRTENPPPAEPEAPAPAEETVSTSGPEGDTTDFSDDDVPDPQAITWTASEFIAHAKSFGWYAVLILATAAFAALVYLINHDFVSVGVIVVAAVLLASYAGHQPRQLQYSVDTSGLSIGRRRFGYNEFRSFSVMAEAGFSSIVFMPLKRFAVPTTIYYAPEDEDRIVGLLSGHLPLEEKGHDAVDRLMHRIRF